MPRPDFEQWLEVARERLTKLTGTNAARIFVGNHHSWQSRKLYLGTPDSVPVLLFENTTVVNNRVVVSRDVTVLREQGYYVVRMSVLHYLPDGYIGISVTYSRQGKPVKAGIVVEPDFDQDFLSKPIETITREIVLGGEYQDYCHAGNMNDMKRRVSLPKKWEPEGDNIVMDAAVKGGSGNWSKQHLVFPDSMKVEELITKKRMRLTDTV